MADTTLPALGSEYPLPQQCVQRVIVTKKPPMFLINALGRGWCGWFLDRFDWNEVSDGQRKRFVTTMVLSKRKRWVWLVLPKRKRKWTIYQRVRLWTVIKTLWLLLWSKSKEAKDKSDMLRLIDHYEKSGKGATDGDA